MCRDGGYQCPTSTPDTSYEQADCSTHDSLPCPADRWAPFLRQRLASECGQSRQTLNGCSGTPQTRGASRAPVVGAKETARGVNTLHYTSIAYTKVKQGANQGSGSETRNGRLQLCFVRVECFFGATIASCSGPGKGPWTAFTNGDENGKKEEL